MSYYYAALISIAAQLFAVLAAAIYVFVCPWLGFWLGKIKSSLRHK